MAEEDKKDTTRWKSLSTIRLTDEEYDDLKLYLEEKTIPDSHDIPEKRRRYIQKYKDFFFDKATKSIQVFVNSIPPWAKDRKSGEALYDVKLPFTLTVLKISQQDGFLRKLWKDVKSGGYRGVETMFDRIRREVVGIRRSDIEDWIKKQSIKQLQQPIQQVITKPILTTRCFEHLEIDLIDADSLSDAKRGLNKQYAFIFTCVDLFSKFLWAIPIKNKTGPVVANALQKIITTMSKSPEILSSDNGGEFTSHEMKALALSYGIELRNSLPYRPQTNGAVERVNGTLKRAIQSYLADHDTKVWYDALPRIVMSYNTSRHSTTKRRPVEVLYAVEHKDNLLRTLVKENIQAAADRMVQRSIQKYSGTRGELEIGDTVRIDKSALKTERKRRQSFGKKGMLQWSKETYQVADQKEETETENTLYAVMDSNGDGELFGEDGEIRWFYRHQLQLVGEGDEVDVGVEERKDLQFGLHDPEAHLHELHARNEDVPQEVIDQKEEEKEQKEIQRLAQEVAEGVKPGKKKKSVKKKQERPKIPEGNPAPKRSKRTVKKSVRLQYPGEE